MYTGEKSSRPQMVGFDLFSLAAESQTEVWPENEAAFGLFCRVNTQWRVGMAGPTGLDHAAVWAHIDHMELSPDDARDLFDDVLVMEIEALETMAEKDG